MARRSFKTFVDKELGKFASFLIYALLEWFLIFILFIDGFLAFLANEFARFFELQIPCLLCTRIDHVLVHRAKDFYYNDSICESHKKDVSYLAYCHDHKKLLHIRKMCDSCLLSFASKKPSGSSSYKDIEMLLDNRDNITLSAAKKEDSVQIDKSQSRCDCCGEPLKMKLYVKGKGLSIAMQAPAPSPRAAFVNLRNERNRNLELPRSRFALEDEDGMNSPNLARDNFKDAMVQIMEEGNDIIGDRTPNFERGNKLFGILLSDSANSTPRLASRVLRKSPLGKTEFTAESTETSVENVPILEPDVDDQSEVQAPLDQNALISLYNELDKERSASAVAANNAMAMITRLQAEKAEFQMEALQYQRLMEEQAEYDQEALQAANELAAKREEDIRALEAELDVYREKFSELTEEDFARFSHDFEYYHDMNSSNAERAEFLSPTLSFGEVSSHNDQFGSGTPKSQRGFQLRRFCDLNLSRLKSLNVKMNMNFLTDDGAPSPGSSSDNVWPGQDNKLMRIVLQLHERVKGLESEHEIEQIASPHHDTEKEKLLTEICDNLRKLRNVIASPFSDDHEA